MITKNEAEKISVELRRAAGLLDQCAAIAKERASGDEFRELRYQVGKVMGEMYVLVLSDLWKRFPELEPEGVKETS